MILVKFLQKSGHDGRTVKGSLGVDIEPPAVFRDYRHFTVIQIDDLTMSPAEGVLLLFQIFRIGNEKFPVKLEKIYSFLAIY